MGGVLYSMSIFYIYPAYGKGLAMMYRSLTCSAKEIFLPLKSKHKIVSNTLSAESLEALETHHQANRPGQIRHGRAGRGKMSEVDVALLISDVCGKT